MKRKILVLDDYKPIKKIFIKNLKGFKLIFKTFKNQTELNKYLKKNYFFAIYTSFGYMLGNKNLENISQNLKFIISPTTGTDHIDIEYCKNKNIKILTLKNEKEFLKNITATAELTWGLIIGLAKNLSRFTEDVVQKGHWNRNEYINHDLKGNSLGIIGYGRIGKIISNYAKAFDMKIFVYEKNVKKRISSKFIKFVSLKKALSCKFITIHIPLEKNYNFLSKKILNQISKDSYVINTSRGDIFDEKGLINFIKSKSSNGFAFDVLPSDVIWKNKISKKYKFLKKMNYNFFITPHIGGNTVESRSKTTIFMIKKFLKKLTRN